jgi:hypothetical protein
LILLAQERVNLIGAIASALLVMLEQNARFVMLVILRTMEFASNNTVTFVWKIAADASQELAHVNLREFVMTLLELFNALAISLGQAPFATSVYLATPTQLKDALRLSNAQFVLEENAMKKKVSVNVQVIGQELFVMSARVAGLVLIARHLEAKQRRTERLVL